VAKKGYKGNAGGEREKMFLGSGKEGENLTSTEERKKT